MSDIRDFSGKNRKFTGTTGVKIPAGTQAQRVDETAQLRFNTDTNLMEYYTGTDWKPIDSPPTVTGISIAGRASGTTGYIDRTGGFDSTVETIVISGSLFDTTGATVTFEGTAGGAGTVTTQSITRDSSSQLTVTVNSSDFIEADDPYTVKVTNGSGLSGLLEAAIDVNAPPTFATAADANIGNLFEGSSSFGGLSSVAATDADGDTVTHTISAGALPTGVSLNTNGTLTGTVGGGQAGSDFTFTVAAATTQFTSTRQFVVSVVALPSGGTVTTDGNNRIHSFTTSGTFTTAFDQNVDVLVVGGGGGGSGAFSGGAGGGGVVYATSKAITTASSPYTITVGTGGQGGLGWQNVNAMVGTNGADSVAFGLTAKGGGGGGAFDYTYDPGANSSQTARTGGCGGGGAPVQASMTDSTRIGASSNQANFSGATSYGTSGGNGQSAPDLNNYRGGGGGGASQAGINASVNATGPGGNGQAFTITGSSVTYAGGGGGSSQGGGGLGSGGSGGGGTGIDTSSLAQAGTDGLGGGGGAGGYNGGTNARIGGDGGDGVVIIKYDTTTL